MVHTRPLEGMRVVEMSCGSSEMCGRFLADLGADVLLVEPSGGCVSRSADPCADDASIAFAFRNANKRSRVIDLIDAAGSAELLALLGQADVWIVVVGPDGSFPGAIDVAELQQQNPSLVILSVSDFGTTGPCATWVASDPVLLAMAAIISRSGVSGRPPIIPPGELADDAGAMQAAWAVMVAYWQALRTGRGDILDFSRLEGITQIIDPAFGAIGTAAAAMAGSSPGRGRPNPIMYPIFPCRDGNVRFCVLAPRQWIGLRTWLGDPEEFADRKYEQLGQRFRDADRLYPLIAEMCRDQPTMELVARGQELGVPVAPVLSPPDLLQTEHFAVRNSFTDLAIGARQSGRAPAGHVLVDGERAGIGHAAPRLDEHEGQTWTSTRRRPVTVVAHQGRPLEGLRVLDLGVIVAGGETGRLFADQGADVIKVENRNFPDGMRASLMNPGFASTHRNKRSLGIDLRSPEGIALFERLVVVADVVLTNFKPGTLEALGVAYDRMRELNERIVLVTSSAMGESGPWRDWMGYGPLVRSVSGMTHMWGDTGTEAGFGDATTVFPDHLAARIAAAAVMAALVRRTDTGIGAHIEVAQSETILNALGVLYTQASIDPGSVVRGSAVGPDAPWGVYPCLGDDDWCVVTVRNDVEWASFVAALGDPEWAKVPAWAERGGRVADRALINDRLSAWTSQRPANEVAEVLQGFAVPAAPMLRVEDQVTDPQMVARGFFRTVRQPGVPEDLVSERGPVPSRSLPEPDTRPAPFLGQHSREVCREWLELDDPEIDGLIDSSILQDLSDADRAVLGAAAG